MEITRKCPKCGGEVGIIYRHLNDIKTSTEALRIKLESRKIEKDEWLSSTCRDCGYYFLQEVMGD